MKTIGVTGGIGAGKTVVSKILTCMGVPVYNSDLKAKEIVNTDLNIKKNIIDLLGQDAYLNGFYNPNYVASKVFADIVLMQKLNSIIHPAVKLDFDTWKETQNVKFIAKETALLFQTELWKSVDFSILVFADQTVRVKRILERDPQRNLVEIDAILNKQGDQKKILEKADFIIYNNGNESIIAQLREILKKIEF